MSEPDGQIKSASTSAICAPLAGGRRCRKGYRPPQQFRSYDLVQGDLDFVWIDFEPPPTWEHAKPAGRAKVDRGWLLVTAAFLVSGLAQAEEPTAMDQSDRLFNEGRAQLARGEVARACQSFAGSYELRARNGTLLNLAVCLERQGDVVGAFHRFQQSLAAAKADNRVDRQRLAEQHLDELRHRLGWLTIKGAQLANMQVTLSCDGLVVEPSTESLPLQPGVHVVRVTAQGRVSFEQAVTLTAGATASLRIPELAALVPQAAEAQPAATAAPKRSPPLAKTSLSGLKPVSAARDSAQPLDPAPWLLAFGGVTLAVGGVFGTRALLDGSEIRQACPNRTCASDEASDRARSLDDRARTEAWVADVAIPVGAVALALGTYLLLGKSNRVAPVTRGAPGVAGAGPHWRWTW